MSLVGLTVFAASCAAGHPAPGKALGPPIKVYTFPLSESDHSLVCVETRFDPEPPCLTVGRLRRMAREVEAN